MAAEYKTCSKCGVTFRTGMEDCRCGGTLKTAKPKKLDPKTFASHSHKSSPKAMKKLK